MEISSKSSFVKFIKILLCSDKVDEVVSDLAAKQVPNRPSELDSISNWYVGLPSQDKEKIRFIAENAIDRCIFTFLKILEEGIEIDDNNKIDFEIYCRMGLNRLQINEKDGLDLSMLYFKNMYPQRLKNLTDSYDGVA